MKDTIINKVLKGDVREIAGDLPDDFFQCIITSPPYFNLRDYSEGSEEKEIGKESSHEEYVSNLVEVFNILKPKLKSDGLLWLNLGDAYKNKMLLGMPWRVALALQDSGWVLRSDILFGINQMPCLHQSKTDQRQTMNIFLCFLKAMNISMTPTPSENLIKHFRKTQK